MKKNKHKPYIEGDRIYLRQIGLSDASRNYCNWLNDPEVNRYLPCSREKWSVNKLKDYIKKIKSRDDSLFFAILLKDYDKHIGNIKIGSIDKAHNFADIGLVIGEKLLWGEGYGAEAIKLVAEYAFKNLKIHRLNAGAYSNNIGSIKAFQKSGFSIEGRQKKKYLCGNKYVDNILLGCVNKK